MLVFSILGFCPPPPSDSYRGSASVPCWYSCPQTPDVLAFVTVFLNTPLSPLWSLTGELGRYTNEHDLIGAKSGESQAYVLLSLSAPCPCSRLLFE